jgi:UDP-hydrolysing UDP-N-acetyl-D-glucosamine 2-epimerase
MKNKKKKKICIVTTSRSEYGLLYCLIEEIEKDEDLVLQLVVGGSHLSPEFGKTVSEIEQYDLPIKERVEFLISSDTRVGAAKSTGLAAISFADSFNRLEPNVVVLLGDRYEILAIAMVAVGLNIPIAHIHGGELTEGAIDEKIRHAVTKLSAIHFPACERYVQRLIQMGEQPSRVFNHGAVGLDQISKINFLTKQELEKSLKANLSGKVFVCTYHPVTAVSNGGLPGLIALLEVLDSIQNVTIVLTKANSDPGGVEINKLLESATKRDNEKYYLFDSLGIKRYMSLLAISDLVIGNSSSGLIEAPFLGIPTVNIGGRQNGRELASSVVSCSDSSGAIQEAIKGALSEEFKKNEFQSPYGKGSVSVNIKNTIKSYDFVANSIKKFYDQETINEPNFCHS